MTLLLAALLAFCCTSSVWGGLLVTTIETDLVKGDCSVNGTGIHLNHWAEGVSYSNSKTEDGYLAIEYNGHTAYCCRVPKVDYESQYPCTTPPPPPPKCPTGYEEFEGKCYLFAIKSSGWADARKACELLDSHLARPDASANAFIVRKIKNSGHDFWFDLNDRNSTDMVYTNSLAPEFVDWAEGEPNNHFSIMFGSEDCAAYDSEKGFKWNDENCDSELRFICERNLV